MTTTTLDVSGNAFAEMNYNRKKWYHMQRSAKRNTQWNLVKTLNNPWLDAETELANILSAEILAEINREVVRTIYINSEKGVQTGNVTNSIFDLDD